MDSESRKNELRRLQPEVPAEFLEQHLDRLPSRYFSSFEAHEQKLHAERLARLDAEHPFDVMVRTDGDGMVECTILAFDYPGEFSVLTGVLGATGYSILAGNVFTYSHSSDELPSRGEILRRRRLGRPVPTKRGPRRRIIDRLVGTLSPASDLGAWRDEVVRNLTPIMSLLERGDEGSATRARQRTNELVADSLSSMQAAERGLFPMEMQVETTPALTRMRIVSEDTPFFLYSLATALALHDISIEHVQIRTVFNRVEDELEFVDATGRVITDPKTIDQIKLSALFTKQFTYFLPNAPDPYSALVRFETMVQDLLALSAQERWEDLLRDPKILQDLARLLGASNFLWEDFLRLEYENIVPMLKLDSGAFSTPSDEVRRRLDAALDGAGDPEDKRRVLNEFKDREAYLIDLDHILDSSIDFLRLSNKLTRLAEAVIDAAVRLVWDEMVARHGEPTTIAGIPASYAVLGLGKLGGAALGYASDIELLFVFGDNGNTAGPAVITNAEFYEQLFRDATKLVAAKREGIFHVDLRLRPYGNSGPIACSLENFCRYYGHDGPAHAYERLALVRMRAIGGDEELGRRITRLRDEMVYAGDSIDLPALRELRERQLAEKTKPGTLNAKFSPGALVDLEYGVQILQVIHGKNVEKLRTPRIHEALEGLTHAGVMSIEEAERLVEAYHFLRKLINGLRMLRGNAQDLFLPPLDSVEYTHLARRVRYVATEQQNAAEKLHVDFETHTAAVRAFVEHHLGRESLPGPPVGNAADLILSDSLPDSLRRRILEQGGFAEPERAYRNLKALAGTGRRRDRFAQLSILAWDALVKSPDPDMALNNWERYVQRLASADEHFVRLLSQPKRLDILLAVLSASQFLADTLVKNPEFLSWVSQPEVLHTLRTREAVEHDLRGISSITPGRADWSAALRRFRRREILRIGTRDICLHAPMAAVVTELSNVAEAILHVHLGRVFRRNVAEGGPADWSGFAVLALGKLGGNELNYSSDLDLVAVCGDAQSSHLPTYTKILEELRADLTRHTEEGYVYRIDYRLRPYGRAGALVQPESALRQYFQRDAALWETQALLKLRPVSGDMAFGEAVSGGLTPNAHRNRPGRDVVASIRSLRDQAVRQAGRSHLHGVNVKAGVGGIRDIEFLLQGLQLIHGAEHPSIVTGNTLAGLEALGTAGILPNHVVETLKDDYVHLRRVEHLLQIYGDRQIHALPKDEAECRHLARRLGEEDAGTFSEQLAQRMERVRTYFTTYLLETEASAPSPGRAERQ
jgi:glutamate-ammonia-ligase adenylyltransferase